MHLYSIINTLFRTERAWKDFSQPLDVPSWMYVTENYKSFLVFVILTQQSLHQTRPYNDCGNGDGSVPPATTSFGLKELH